MIDLLPERLTKKFEVDDCGCWVWTASMNRKGYGQYWHNGRLWIAHRVVYTLLVGDIPRGLHLDHLCRVPQCVNPEHLEPVTSKENMRRGLHPNNITHLTKMCKRGHSISGTNNYRGIGICRECNLQAMRRWRERKKANL